MLISGQLKAGDRLPPENELSDQLGLSRSSLREAVKALELIRVLDVRRGDGTYVTSLEPGLLTETMGFMVEIHQESSAPELLEVRRILEPGAAAHAAARINARGLAALRTCLDSVPVQASAVQLAAHDFAFHSQIARASGNPYLAGMLDSLTGSALRLRTWHRIVEAGAVSAVLGEHAAILEALTLGDADLARSLMTVHVASAERWLRRPPAEAPAAQPPVFRPVPMRLPDPPAVRAQAPAVGFVPAGKSAAAAAEIPLPVEDQALEDQALEDQALPEIPAPTPIPAPAPAPEAAAQEAAAERSPKPALKRTKVLKRPLTAGSSPAPRSFRAESAAPHQPSSPQQIPPPQQPSTPRQPSTPDKLPSPQQLSSPQQAPAPEQAPPAAPARRPAPQIARIAPEPALYELFAMPSAPAQKAARKPRRPA